MTETKALGEYSKIVKRFHDQHTLYFNVWVFLPLLIFWWQIIIKNSVIVVDAVY